jgi:hypothetical protein
VASERRTPTRATEQRLRALAKANQVRSARAELKHDLAAGTAVLANILAEPPPCARGARVRDLLLAVPGLGPARTRRLLAHCQIAETKTVAVLTGRQRVALIDLLHHH